MIFFLSCQEVNFYDQNWQGSELGSTQKIWDFLFISATVEVSNFKFGTQLLFGEYATIATLVPNLVGAGCATAAPQKLLVSRNSYRNVIKQQI